MLTLEYLKEAATGDTFKGPSGMRLPGSEVEYAVTTVVMKADGSRHVTIKGKLFGADFIRTDAIIKTGDTLVMHTVIL